MEEGFRDHGKKKHEKTVMKTCQNCTNFTKVCIQEVREVYQLYWNTITVVCVQKVAIVSSRYSCAMNPKGVSTDICTFTALAPQLALWGQSISSKQNLILTYFQTPLPGMHCRNSIFAFIIQSMSDSSRSTYSRLLLW